MPVPTSITDLQATESLNSPQGGDQVGGKIDDFFRSHAAIIKRQFSKGADINSAATLPIPADGSFFNVVKSAVPGILGFADNFDGRIVYLKFEAGITLTHSASLILPGAANVITIANDVAVFINEAPGSWRCISYPRLISDFAAAALTAHKTSGDHDDRYNTKTQITDLLKNRLIAEGVTYGGWYENDSSRPYFSNGTTITFLQAAGQYVKTSGGFDISIYTVSGAANVIYYTVNGGNAGTLWTTANFTPTTKADAGAQVTWRSGVVEFGAIQIGTNIGGGTIADTPVGYVMVGVRSTDFSTFYIRGVQLSNQ